MPGTRDFAEVSYTLVDCIVSSFNPSVALTAAAFGTPAALALGQAVEISFDADTDTLKGYGRAVALLTVITGAKIKIKMGGVDFSVLSTLSGITNTNSGTTPNQTRKNVLGAGGRGLPYFSCLGRMATDEGGSMIVGLMACMLDSFPNFTMDGETNKFNMSETDGRAMPVDISSSAVIAVGREYESAADWVAPVSAAGVYAFFTGS